MAKFNWKEQKDIDNKIEEDTLNQKNRDFFKNKKFKDLSSKEKDSLLEELARQAGLID